SKALGDVIDGTDVPIVDEYHGSFEVAADKASQTVTITGSGYEPDAPVSLAVRYNAAPTDEVSDYADEVRTDKHGVLNVTLPEAVTQAVPWLGGHSYYASVDGVVQSDSIYATVVKAHSSARVSLRIKGKAKLNFSVDSETYEFTSSNPNIVAVDQTGTVTALRAGTALVRLRALDGSGLVHLVTVSVG
ncbi:MAG: Ig-like domain-containing protein, partial [Oscillospiraceae bacterium]|nr:Ig-like domain-containing protein [Oscillospiraceae bacterium]